VRWERGAWHYWVMRKRERKPGPIESERAGGGVVAAIAQDIELTAEQIKDTARDAVATVEKKLCAG
jgi:hypothetical protein